MEPTRRLACPTLAAPMPTGDGWLARLPPLTDAMTPAMLGALAAAAKTHGNGRIEISKRGNLQVRGLASPDGSALATSLATAGFDLAEGIPVSLDPLADLFGKGDAGRSLVAALHAAIAASELAPRLAPKLSMVVDLGTPLAPRSLGADLRLKLIGDRVHIALGGTVMDARLLGSVGANAAIAAVIAILRALADRGREARFTGSNALTWNREFLAALAVRLEPFGIERDPLSSPLPKEVVQEGPSAQRLDASSDPVGRIRGLPVAVHGIAFPFGQAEADDLDALAVVAEKAGVAAFAPAVERALLIAGPKDAVAATVARAAELGFITESSDIRRFIAACAGSAGCLSGRYPARQFAADLAPRLMPLLDGSLDLHFSGCRKGCAHPTAADITIAGIDKDAALVLDGRARDEPTGIGPPDELAGRLLALAEAVATRPAGETARAALDRLGPGGAAAGMVRAGTPAGIE